jgi:UDP-N-acetyl-L-fucosamine synthase
LKKLKVLTIVGTRPEIIRLSVLIPKLDEHTDHVFVHTGQNNHPQLNQVFFDDLGLRQPDHYLSVDTGSMGAVMGDTIRKSEELFLMEKPDAVMILGDTNSAIAAVVAERMHIPVYHMEAGNRSFDNNVPEELNRKMVDHVSTFNLPYNDFSYNNLLREGIHPRFLSKTGSPIAEIFEQNRDGISNSSILAHLGIASDNYFLVSMHRQENVDSPRRLGRILDTLKAVHAEWKVPIIVSTHPRTLNRLEALSRDDLIGIEFHSPFGYLDYSRLQMESKCVISDSGTVAEEAAIMGFHAVTLRDSIERPEALETGHIMLSAIESGTLNEAIKLELTLSQRVLPRGYEVNDFSNRVLTFLYSTCHLANQWLNRRAFD